MQKLTCHEKEAWAREGKETAIRCLEFEKKFVDEHLSQWVPTFCDKVKEDTRVNFYGEIAELTKQFINFDSKLIAKNLISHRERGERREMLKKQT